MKRVRLFFLSALLLLCSCSTTPTPAGPKTAALIQRVPEVQAIVDRLDFVLEAQRRAVAAELVATKHAAGAISDPTVKQAVTMSVDSAQTQLGAEPDPEKTAAAVERVDLALAGKIDDASEKYRKAAEEAAKVISGATKDREERDRKLAEAVTLATSAKTENEALTAKIEADKKAAVDKARNEFMHWLNLGLLGLAGICYLVAAATAYFSSGREWLRAAIATLVGSIFVCVAYTINQPYFKYVAGVVTLLVVAAVAAYVWSARNSAKNMIEADRVRSTLKQVVTSVDQLRNEAKDEAKPVLEKFRDLMDADHKQVVKEIRGETALD